MEYEFQRTIELDPNTSLGFSRIHYRGAEVPLEVFQKVIDGPVAATMPWVIEKLIEDEMGSEE